MWWSIILSMLLTLIKWLIELWTKGKQPTEYELEKLRLVYGRCNKVSQMCGEKFGLVATQEKWD